MAEKTRPCYLVLDPEHGGSISTRKLVLETAKLNVLTAYSSAEAIETVRRFPRLDGVVLDVAVRDMPCTELVRALKEIAPELLVIAVGAPGHWECTGADAHVASFVPGELLEKLTAYHRARIEAIAAHDADLTLRGS